MVVFYPLFQKKVQTKGFLTLRAIHTENKQEATGEVKICIYIMDNDRLYLFNIFLLRSVQSMEL